MFLCLQLFNVCIYVPARLFPGTIKADLTETLFELAVECYAEDRTVLQDKVPTNGSNTTQTLSEEILEDLHPPEDNNLDFALISHTLIEHRYYHFTPDIKTRVLSVVSPPPDFC
ncbi:hypothetical protein BH09BAC1_BH09BAC1_29810 [soil metagenome]